MASQRKLYPNMTIDEMRNHLEKKGIPTDIAVEIADETIAQVLVEQANGPQAPRILVILVSVVIKIIALWFFWWMFSAISHNKVIPAIMVSIAFVALTIWDIRRGMYRL